MRRVGTEPCPHHQDVVIVVDRDEMGGIEQLGVGQRLGHHDGVEMLLHILDGDRPLGDDVHQFLRMKDFPAQRHSAILSTLS